MNRRNFLASMLALAAAPAIVRASSIMPVRPLVRVPLATILQARDLPYLRIYSGIMGEPGRLLAEAALPDGWMRASNGVGVGAPLLADVVATGVAGHFAIERDGNWLVRGSVGSHLSGADLAMSTDALCAGQALAINDVCLHFGGPGGRWRYSKAQRELMLDAIADATSGGRGR